MHEQQPAGAGQGYLVARRACATPRARRSDAHSFRAWAVVCRAARTTSRGVQPSRPGAGREPHAGGRRCQLQCERVPVVARRRRGESRPPGPGGKRSTNSHRHRSLLVLPCLHSLCCLCRVFDRLNSTAIRGYHDYCLTACQRLQLPYHFRLTAMLLL